MLLNTVFIPKHPNTDKDTMKQADISVVYPVLMYKRFLKSSSRNVQSFIIHIPRASRTTAQIWKRKILKPTKLKIVFWHLISLKLKIILVLIRKILGGWGWITHKNNLPRKEHDVSVLWFNCSSQSVQQNHILNKFGLSKYLIFSKSFISCVTMNCD